MATVTVSGPILRPKLTTRVGILKSKAGSIVVPVSESGTDPDCAVSAAGPAGKRDGPLLPPCAP